MSKSVSVHTLHKGWSMMVVLGMLFRVFLLMRIAEGEVLPVLVGGGWESRSNSADEAARRAEREFGSLEVSPADLEVEAASLRGSES